MNEISCGNLVRSRGLEPPRLAALAPQASASASSATTAMTSIVKAREEGVKRASTTIAYKYRLGFSRGRLRSGRRLRTGLLVGLRSGWGRCGRLRAWL